MTVSDLIVELQKFDDALNIAVSCQAGCVEDEEISIYVEDGKLKIAIE